MPSYEDVKQMLLQHGLEPLEFSQPTPDAETAADAVGCTSAEIAKTLLVQVGEQLLAVITAGDTRINSSRLKKASGLSGRVRFPGPEDVQRHSGYRPGGVSPFLLPEGLPVLVDGRLKAHPLCYPAAGNDRSAVAIGWQQLLELSGGREVDVCVPLV